jgi:hypothetical protein
MICHLAAPTPHSWGWGLPLFACWRTCSCQLPAGSATAPLDLFRLTDGRVALKILERAALERRPSRPQACPNGWWWLPIPRQLPLETPSCSPAAQRHCAPWRNYWMGCCGEAGAGTAALQKRAPRPQPLRLVHRRSRPPCMLSLGGRSSGDRITVSQHRDENGLFIGVR